MPTPGKTSNDAHNTKSYKNIEEVKKDYPDDHVIEDPKHYHVYRECYTEDDPKLDKAYSKAYVSLLGRKLPNGIEDSEIKKAVHGRARLRNLNIREFAEDFDNRKHTLIISEHIESFPKAS